MRFVLVLILIIVIRISTTNAQYNIDSLERELPTAVNETKIDILLKLAKANWKISQQKTQKYSKEALDLSLLANNDTLATKACLILSACHIHTEPDTAKIYAEKVIELSKKTNRKKDQIGALLNIGVIHNNQGEKHKAISYYDKAMEIINETGLENKKAVIVSNLGVAYMELGDYKKAVDYFQQSIDIREKSGDKSGMAFSLHMIGIIYNKWGNNEQALEYYNHSLNIKEKIGDNFGIIFSMNSIGQLHQANGDYQKALECYLRAYDISNEIGHKRFISGALNNIGTVYGNLNKTSKALEYYQQSLELKRELNDVEGIVSTLENMGGLYIDNKKYNQAIICYKQSIEIVESPSYQIQSFGGYKLISEAYSKIGKNELALDYYKKYTALKDSVFSAEKHEQIVEMQTKYESEKKEKEIVLLNAEKYAKDAELKQQNTLIISLSAGFVIILAFLILVTIQYKQKHKAYNDLVRKNLEVVEAEKNAAAKYEKSSLHDQKQEKLITDLLHLIEVERVFLDSNLNINDLSKQLDTNSKYLSQAINVSFDMNFNSFINKFRVKEAQLLLGDNKNNKFTIEGIAANVGFSNKATFNAAFKKHTGLTPSFYKKSLQENSNDFAA